MLGRVFGRGPTYDTWLATQHAQLHRMEAALAQGGNATQSDTTGVYEVLAATWPTDDAAHALVG